MTMYTRNSQNHFEIYLKLIPALSPTSLLVVSAIRGLNGPFPTRIKPEPKYESYLNQNTFVTAQTHIPNSLIWSRTESDNSLPFGQSWKDTKHEEKSMTSWWESHICKSPITVEDTYARADVHLLSQPCSFGVKNSVTRHLSRLVNVESVILTGYFNSFPWSVF